MIADLTVAQENFENLAKYYSQGQFGLNWDLVFTLPAFLKVWWQNFNAGAELYLASVKRQDQIIGLAPLQIRNGTASIIGSTDVCDYQDFIVVRGLERDFFSSLLDDLRRKGIPKLHLETLRPDSAVVTYLMPLAGMREYRIDYHQVDVSSDLVLPPDWAEYLKMLNSKQRHELRRKMRNLQDIGDTHYRTLEGENASRAIESFLNLFPESRTDKARFMTPAMQNFFRSLAEALADVHILKFGSLEAGPRVIAMVMYFDYRNNIYLYNSAYDPAYESLSAGIISKARCIQDSIGKGKIKFDFLKGSEKYKSYLGGQEIPLYCCDISAQ